MQRFYLIMLIQVGWNFRKGQVVELTPSKTKRQGMARIKWTAFNQHGDPVYTFTPIRIVPRRPT
jgi:acyl dehydratase